MKTSHLDGFIITAIDGELGSVDELYFDDESWAIRYLTIDTGGWLGGGRVLISPISVTRTVWPERRLYVNLTRKQVENSPNIDTHQPISRLHEDLYLSYYGYQSYWGGPSMWGPSFYPSPLAMAAPPRFEAGREKGDPADAHLRSTTAVRGYSIQATDGEVGHVDGFVMDDETWAIRYIEVATRNWWPGKKVLLSPDWIERVSWSASSVYVNLGCEVIKTAPEYLDSVQVDREYESQLHAHYNRAGYWAREVAQTVPDPDAIWSPDHIVMHG